jgi:hypothetical protein
MLTSAVLPGRDDRRRREHRPAHRPPGAEKYSLLYLDRRVGGIVGDHPDA